MHVLWKSLKVLFGLVGGLAVLFVVVSVVYIQMVDYDSTVVAWPEEEDFKDPVPWVPDDPKRVRILSIDGGGIHGIVSLELLKFLEQQSGKPISELFDVFAGPSTGSIISTALLIPDDTGKPQYSVEDVIEQYESLGTTILSAPLYHQMLTLNGLLGPRLLNHSKIVVDHKLFGGHRFGDLLRPTLVPLYSRSKAGFVTFRNWDKTESNIKLGALIAAATSVPTYFPAMQLSGHEDYSGLYADALFILNNPAHAAFLHALERYPDAEFVIVSLGVKQADVVSEEWGVKGGLFQWLMPIFSMVLQGQSDLTAQDLSRMATIKESFKLDFFSLAPELPLDIGPMDASKDNIAQMRSLTSAYIEKNRSELEEIVALLTGGEQKQTAASK